MVWICLIEDAGNFRRVMVKPAEWLLACGNDKCIHPSLRGMILLEWFCWDEVECLGKSCETSVLLLNKAKNQDQDPDYGFWRKMSRTLSSYSSTGHVGRRCSVSSRTSDIIDLAMKSKEILVSQLGVGWRSQRKIRFFMHWFQPQSTPCKGLLCSQIPITWQFPRGYIQHCCLLHLFSLHCFLPVNLPWMEFHPSFL